MCCSKSFVCVLFDLTSLWSVTFDLLDTNRHMNIKYCQAWLGSIGLHDVLLCAAFCGRCCFPLQGVTFRINFVIWWWPGWITVCTIGTHIVQWIHCSNQYTRVAMICGTRETTGTLAQGVGGHFFHFQPFSCSEQSTWFLSFAAKLLFFVFFFEWKSEWISLLFCQSLLFLL